eukprot:gene23773-30039_t
MSSHTDSFQDLTSNRWRLFTDWHTKINTSDGKKHGKGIMLYATGDVYEGDFVDDKKHGRGIFRFAYDQGSYEGEWKNNKFHGTGAMRVPDCTYEGEYENGLRNGKGTMTWQNGAAYHGAYLNDKRHGFGHYKSAHPGIDYE